MKMTRMSQSASRRQRPLRVERLERRELLAASLGPIENGLNFVGSISAPDSDSQPRQIASAQGEMHQATRLNPSQVIHQRDASSRQRPQDQDRDSTRTSVRSFSYSVPLALPFATQPDTSSARNHAVSTITPSSNVRLIIDVVIIQTFGDGLSNSSSATSSTIDLVSSDLTSGILHDSQAPSEPLSLLSQAAAGNRDGNGSLSRQAEGESSTAVAKRNVAPEIESTIDSVAKDGDRTVAVVTDDTATDVDATLESSINSDDRQQLQTSVDDSIDNQSDESLSEDGLLASTESDAIMLVSHQLSPDADHAEQQIGAIDALMRDNALAWDTLSNSPTQPTQESATQTFLRDDVGIGVSQSGRETSDILAVATDNPWRFRDPPSDRPMDTEIQPSNNSGLVSLLTTLGLADDLSGASGDSQNEELDAVLRRFQWLIPQDADLPGPNEGAVAPSSLDLGAAAIIATASVSWIHRRGQQHDSRTQTKPPAVAKHDPVGPTVG
ncbi:hypothetical protein [Crateriforma conspicua]|uniref:hypothetical protein n=1 Tax=Crateriforma conspicua TaxID=2527996 RepID=UPI00118B4693|nr:hypothetical protein [Crateriforma conspicua]QDV63977.1 hypothetical protein Mal65_31240 [Crateriforma conspicua]